MIVVDTSALIAIVLGEARGQACFESLESEEEVVISAGTLAEALIVAGRRDAGGRLQQLLDELGFEVADVTRASALRIGLAYGRWGKGVHPAGLNFGDCFAYELAKERGCGLLYVGDDFAKTDVESVL